MGFSRQEYWSGLPFPSLGALPNSGIELAQESFRPPTSEMKSVPTPVCRYILSFPGFCSVSQYKVSFHCGFEHVRHLWGVGGVGAAPQQE